jgi:uncharacterized protein (TIGR00297 family)
LRGCDPKGTSDDARAVAPRVASTSALLSLSASELKRKVLHVAVGGFAFLLRFLTWPQAAAMAVAAFLFNWQVLPRIGGRRLWRGAEQEKGYPLGILVYPLAVLSLILVFRHALWKAAAVWALLAFGDGMASMLGQAFGGPRLPWNPRKGWIGFVAFVVFGGAGAAFLMVWTRGEAPSAALAPGVMGLALALALTGALVETVPTTLDDNLTVPLVAGTFLALVGDMDFGLFADPDLPRRILLGLAVNVAIAVAAFVARSIDLAGAASAIVIGTAITAGLGLHGLALMIAFFVVGTVATKSGYAKKAARGIAQEKGGARGWKNAWANGGVAAFLAVLAGARPWDWSAASALSGAWKMLTIAYAAAVATATADTCSSEIGKAYGRRTFLITTFNPVPPGTEGAVSLEGTLAGFVGAAIVAGVGVAAGLFGWRAAVVVSVAGLLGSLAESLIGTVAERRGWLDNDLLNALNTAIGAGLAFALVGGLRLLQ